MAEGVLCNLPQMLAILNQNQRDGYIDHFLMAQDKLEKQNTSFDQRLKFAEQIKNLIELISPAKVA